MRVERIWERRRVLEGELRKDKDGKTEVQVIAERVMENIIGKARTLIVLNRNKPGNKMVNDILRGEEEVKDEEEEQVKGLATRILDKFRKRDLQ